MSKEMKNDEVSEEKKNKMNAVEDEFRLTYDQHQAEIDRLEHIAIKAHSELINYLEKTGIPHSCAVTDVGQTYTPQSFFDKFKDLDHEFVEEITGTMPGEYGSGWEQSQICY